MKTPLDERKKLLQRTIEAGRPAVKVVGDLGADGREAFAVCLEHGLEGVMAKKSESLYEKGRRTSSWLKVKATTSAEFVICGYTKGTGERSKTFGALLLGYYEGGKTLRYAGSVGTGFSEQTLAQLKKLLNDLRNPGSPFERKIPGKLSATWVSPELVAEIKFAEWTRDGSLRAPVFLRLREDVEPSLTGPRPVRSGLRLFQQVLIRKKLRNSGRIRQ